MPVKIAIVDDNLLIRTVVRSFIESHTDWEVCGEAADGEAAVALAECLKPDLFVLDLSMPAKDGLEAARDIAVICPKSGMVLFTAHASKQLEIEAERAGIGAVLAKDGNASLVQLVAVLRELNRRTRRAA